MVGQPALVKFTGCLRPLPPAGKGSAGACASFRALHQSAVDAGRTLAPTARRKALHRSSIAPTPGSLAAPTYTLPCPFTFESIAATQALPGLAFSHIWSVPQRTVTRGLEEGHVVVSLQIHTHAAVCPAAIAPPDSRALKSRNSASGLNGRAWSPSLRRCSWPCRRERRQVSYQPCPQVYLFASRKNL